MPVNPIRSGGPSRPVLRVPRSSNPAANRADVLIVSSAVDDHAIIGSIFNGTRWTVRHAILLRDAVALLDRQVIPVLICAQTVTDGTWKDLLAELAVLETPPAMLVTSGTLDDALWAEVLNIGGCDVLVKPFDHREVVWSVGLAWRQWSSRQGKVHATGSK
jgi:DNA-binding response OmpR family regulator